jgi:hypothetical protein
MMSMVKRPWELIQWQKPSERAEGVAKPTAFSEVVAIPTFATAGSLREALRAFGGPYVPGASPLEEAETLLAAGAEVEHGLLAEYLYNSWSLGANAAGPQIRDIAIQEMCHLITVQNLLLFLGGTPHFERQDQAPSSSLDPFAFTLRPFAKSVLEDFLLAEMPPLDAMRSNQREVMSEILAAHQQAGERVNRVGLIYARLYWIFQQDDQPTAAWPEVASAGFTSGFHIQSFPGQGTASTFQMDPVQESGTWHVGSDRGGVIANVDSREAALQTIAAVAAQGEGLAATTAPSHFGTFFDIYETTNFDQLSLLSLPKWPTDPFVAARPVADPAREANRITNSLAAALCGVFDARYRIMLACLRNALARSRSDPSDTAVRTRYVGWAIQEMVGFLKMLAVMISSLPCKQDGTVQQLAAAPTFTLGSLQLPDNPAALDEFLLALHCSAEQAVKAALDQGPDAETKVFLGQIQQIDHSRFPDSI